MAKSEFIRDKPKGVSGEQTLRFVFKVVTILLIAAGVFLATQYFAYLCGYQSSTVGKAEFIFRFKQYEVPVYSIFNILAWTLKYYRHTEVHNGLYAAWKIAGYFSVGAIVFYMFMDLVLLKSINKNVFGTARWGTKKDLEKAGLLGYKGGMILGELANAKLSVKWDSIKQSMVMNLVKPAQKIVQAGIYNVLLAAPTRAGKGVSCVIPTLVSYPGSCIVLDFKGENFNMTSGFRAKFGKVYRWEPTGYEGHHFNPMMEIRAGDDAFSDANLIADILTAPASGASSSASSSHFITAAKDLLTAVILHCLCDPVWTNKSLSGCREFLAQIDPSDPNNNKYVYDLMINATHTTDMIHQKIVEGAGAQRKRPDDEGGSVLSTVNNALAVFADPKIMRNTIDSEFYIDEFIETSVPITLYLTIQYSDVQRISALIRMFITLFSRRFTGGETQATNRKFQVPLLFVLDEFDKLGRMDELEMNMGIHNGFGIHYFLIFQSLNQLNKIYTKDHSFLAHCRNSIFFAPGAGELDEAELISKACGKESISKSSTSYSGGRGSMGFGSASISSQDQERNLINADEIIKLPLDRFILLCQGLPPYIGKKNVYYQDPVFTSRMVKEPAFKSREEAIAMAGDTVKKLSKRRWFNEREDGSEIEGEALIPDDEAAAALAEKYAELMVDDNSDTEMLLVTETQNNIGDDDMLPVITKPDVTTGEPVGDTEFEDAL